VPAGPTIRIVMAMAERMAQVVESARRMFLATYQTKPA
jgi:hypothetical protein